MTTTAPTSSSTVPIQQLGIGTSINVSAIESALATEAQIPLTVLQNQVTSEQTTLSAYGQLASALSSFASSAATLSDSSTFNTLSATVGNATVASASVSSNAGISSATVANHTLSVSQLAQNQTIASGDFSSETATVGTGTITIQYGTYSGTNNSTFTPNPSVGSKSITISSSNSSLSGIVNAINSADVGVTASIINDGTGSRLELSGTNTGLAQGFRVTTSDSADNGSSGLSQLEYDPTNTSINNSAVLLQSAQSAELSVDNIAITSATNQVDGAIQGVNLNLSATTTTPTSVDVSADPSVASSAVQGFVTAYNTMVNGIGTLTAYDASTNTAGPLNGNPTAQIITSDLQNMAASVFSTSDASIQTLADIGITFQSDGTLSLDTGKLDSALNSNPGAVSQLFSTVGDASDSLVGFNTATSATQPGSYALTVSQLATQASATGSSAPNLNITAGVNDTLQVTINSIPVSVTIPSGTYASAASLATAVQTAVNSNATLSAADVSIGSSVSGSGALVLSASNYGSGSTVVVTGGDAESALFGSAPTTSAGLDVAGTLGGVAFTGNGQIATGATGTNAAGLQITIAGGATGSRGTVSYTQGVASQMTSAITSYLDTSNGIIASAESGINSQIANLTAQETQVQTRISAEEAATQAEFTSLSTLLSSLNSTSQFLSEELNGTASSSSSSSGSSSTGELSTNTSS